MTDPMNGIVRDNVIGTAKCKPARNRSPLPRWRLRRVETYIEARLFERIYLAELAQAAGLSQMHFAAQFRVAIGMSPYAYVVRRRLEEAQRLMRDERRSLAGIAFEVGFSSQAHFTRAFKKLSGTTPRKWRLEIMDWLSPQDMGEMPAMRARFMVDQLPVKRQDATDLR